MRGWHGRGLARLTSLCNRALAAWRMCWQQAFSASLAELHSWLWKRGRSKGDREKQREGRKIGKKIWLGKLRLGQRNRQGEVAKDRRGGVLEAVKAAMSYGTSRRSIPTLPAEHLTQTLFIYWNLAYLLVYFFDTHWILTAAMQQNGLSSTYCFFVSKETDTKGRKKNCFSPIGHSYSILTCPTSEATEKQFACKYQSPCVLNTD